MASVRYVQACSLGVCDSLIYVVAHLQIMVYYAGTPMSTSVSDLKQQLKFIGLGSVDEMFQSHFNWLMDHTTENNMNGGIAIGDGHMLGHFMFLMRNVMIRHTQTQTYRGTTPPTTLMNLPPKTERTVLVHLGEDERKEYAMLENAALDFYTKFKETHVSTLSSHYLKLTQKLTPLRIACAGGAVPLEADNDNEDSKDADGDDDEGDTESKKKKKVKKAIVYSDFVFQSKMFKLIEELKTARDRDPSSKSLVFSQFSSSLKYLQQELPKHGFEYRTLTGDMTMAQRAKVRLREGPTLLSFGCLACTFVIIGHLFSHRTVPSVHCISLWYSMQLHSFHFRHCTSFRTTLQRPFFYYLFELEPWVST